MVEISIEFKKGFENLYNVTDMLFINNANMKKIKNGLYVSNDNQSKAFCDSASCIDSLCEEKEIMDKIKTFTQTIGNESENVIDYYNEYYK